MTRLVAIDPGTRLCGWAVFEREMLQRCGVVRSKAPRKSRRRVELVEKLLMLPILLDAASQVVIELPEVYPQRQQKGDPNDLIALAYIAGSIAQAASPSANIHAVLPKEWKGQVPKEVGEKRMRAKLSTKETSRMNSGLAHVPKSLRHNVCDAIALGLWGLGR